MLPDVLVVQVLDVLDQFLKRLQRLWRCIERFSRRFSFLVSSRSLAGSSEKADYGLRSSFTDS